MITCAIIISFFGGMLLGAIIHRGIVQGSSPKKSARNPVLLSIGLLFFAATSQAQVTNVTVTAVIKLSTGQSFTNSVSSGNTNILAAATNAMTKFNLTRASEDPPKAATTNLAHFFSEFTKVQFKQYTNDYDATIVQDLNVKMQALSEQKKSEIRALINAP